MYLESTVGSARPPMRGAVGPSADARGCVPSLLAAWPDASQHWSYRLLSGARSWCQNVASRRACPNERPDTPTPGSLPSE